jgi:type VI secretion system protein ImpB
MDDFDPARVAEQIPALKELLQKRQELSQLLGKMEGNDKLEALLGEVLGNTEKAQSVAKQFGIEGKSPEAPKPEEKK